jgi:hypothetical protein
MIKGIGHVALAAWRLDQVPVAGKALADNFMECQKLRSIPDHTEQGMDCVEALT